MTIVKGLIEQMNGSIEITSEVGVGSTFIITIPFEIAPTPEEVPKREQLQNPDIHGLNLMVAEDNDLNAEIAEILLKDAGADITLVKDGKQAVELFQTSEPGTFNAILMDIMMPVMDGLTATREIRAISRTDAKQIPIIAMTANAFEEDAKKCFAAGMNAHIPKPFQIEQVKKILAQYCKKDLEAK